MLVGPKVAEKGVLATCALHNYLTRPGQTCRGYLPVGVADISDPSSGDIVRGLWRDENNPVDSWLELSQQGNRGHSTAAKALRDTYRHYFNGVGAVSWQNNMI